jgi:hypothetical protein
MERLFSFPVSVAALEEASDQFLGSHLKHLAKPEKGIEGMGSSRLQLLVMPD